MKIVAIEGNVGVGKSTLLTGLVSELQLWSGEDWTHIVEPVDEDPEFLRLLQNTLRQPRKAEPRALFQRYITAQRAVLLSQIKDGNYLIERSLFSDLVFSQAYIIEADECGPAYMRMLESIKASLSDYPRVDAVVYLDRDPAACLGSIIKRNREGEHYELHALEDIKRYHDACLPQIARKYNTPLIVETLGTNYALPSVVAADIMEVLYD